MKSLTTVIPTYNMERFLERCLNSLVVSEELMELLEVLVINDGSKDRSSEIAHSFEVKYPETFRVIDKENGNYGSCVNCGLKEAAGKYIKILDADDWFDTKNFEEFLKLLGSLDDDCVMSEMVQVDDDGNTFTHWKYSLPKEKSFSMAELLKRNQAELMWMHCVAYKTDNLRAINYHQTEGISYTDQEWIFMPMSTCKSIYYFPKVVYRYLVGRNGQTMDPSVLQKNFGQEIKGTTVMATELSKYDNTENDEFEYLNRRLVARCNFVYGLFFLQYKMDTCYDEMVRLDKLIYKHAPYVYKELEKLYRFEPLRYHFVKRWRQNGYPKMLWILRIGMTFGNMFKKIKS